MKKLIRVAVTGGAGQIAYSLLFQIANGNMFGKDLPVALHILEIPSAISSLRGVKMELEDCAFPLLNEIHIGSDPFTIFQDIDYALLVGAKPRTQGMERKDLLRENGKIFVEQGKALDQVASENAKILVVGNPCNTNCWIAMQQAKRIPRENFYAMTRLDQNRAQNLLAEKAQVDITEVQKMTIWGNHSATQVPDFVNARICGKKVEKYITDRKWLENEFISEVQNRGSEVIKARGKSSAASAAHAVIETIRSLISPASSDDWYSVGLCSDGNPYGVKENLIFSFPCRTTKEGKCAIVEGLIWDSFLKDKIHKTENELLEERDIGGLNV